MSLKKPNNLEVRTDEGIVAIYNGFFTLNTDDYPLKAIDNKLLPSN